MDSLDPTTWHQIAFMYDMRSGNARNAFFRYNQIVGGKLRSRHAKAQEIEAVLACRILNRMGDAGMPKSEAVVT